MDLAERLALLEKAQHDTQLQQLLLALCEKDPVYWFNTFCWTFDPRAEHPDIAFNLFPYQEWCIQEWYERLERQEDFGVEKSRDMGVSWMLVLLFQYCWLFRPGWNFLLGSRRENEVDTGFVDPSTLFGKFRYNLIRLPAWMVPKLRDKRLSILNEGNGNLITGESANPSFGRGARQRAILMDEFAFWECADAVYGSTSATTKCRVIVSTPHGESNRFSQLMNQPNAELKEPPV